MNTNDVLRKLRFAARLGDPAMLEMLKAGGAPTAREVLDSWFLKDDEPGWAPCPRASLSALLDGLILARRGPREAPEEQPAKPRAGHAARPQARPSARPPELDNNMILKKLRIAFELREDDLAAIMERASFPVSRTELSALFRKKGQRNYVECQDQLLRNFLAGLAAWLSTGKR